MFPSEAVKGHVLEQFMDLNKSGFCANEGLVCMEICKSPHEERSIVFNPLTQEWKELPPLLHRRNPVLMHMYVDQSSKSYHILAAGSSASGDESLSRITELYDSRTGQWQRVGDLPGPAFALNEYQSGVFQNGNIFCIGFLELGDQTVKGILGYNVEEGVWSTKWTAAALPISTILQLVENNGDLFLFSERDNGPVTEHWVDRIEWTPSEGDSGQKTDTTVTLVNVLRKEKSGGRGLIVYPEYALVPFSESQLCIFNTVDHCGVVYDIEDREKSEALGEVCDIEDQEKSEALEEVFDIRASSLANIPSNPGRSFWCFILCIVTILTLMNVAGASLTSAPGPSSSQASSGFPTVWYWGVRATIVAAIIGVLGLCITIYMCLYPRERGDSLRGVLREFFRPFEKGAVGLRMYARGVKLREGSVDVVRLRSSRGSSRGSSPEAFPV